MKINIQKIFYDKKNLLLLTIIFILIILIYFFGINKYHEHFSEMKNIIDKTDEHFANSSFKILPMYTPEYLFPTKDLQKECNSSQGLEPAYGPTSCFENGQYIPTANCKCRDKNTGDCKICYPKIKKDDTSSSTIYKGDTYKLSNLKYTEKS